MAADVIAYFFALGFVSSSLIILAAAALFAVIRALLKLMGRG